ncbi:hypothetical protein NM688_g6544 [Phlebia brevispora]|uniref:Uncharacterized protein n=1 Tax=Phlebia brevispora TaxID=194682 RepID=A0ACC1SF41_9APHY|nr:hypothetical protein NM688_g6544 [Phlebia brevispora]
MQHVLASLFYIFALFNVLCATETSQVHLVHLNTSSGGLVTSLFSHEARDMQHAIQLAPCTLLHTFASWSAHARYFIYDQELLQTVARQFKPDIESRRLAIVVAQINDPPAEGDPVWDYIVDGSYWGSFAMFSDSLVENKVAMIPIVENITYAFSGTTRAVAIRRAPCYHVSLVPSGGTRIVLASPGRRLALSSSPEACHRMRPLIFTTHNSPGASIPFSMAKVTTDFTGFAPAGYATDNAQVVKRSQPGARQWDWCICVRGVE